MDSIKTLNSITDTLLQSPSALSQSDRRQVLQACDRLRAFESPADSITRLVFSVCRGSILCFFWNAEFESVLRTPVILCTIVCVVLTYFRPTS